MLLSRGSRKIQTQHNPQVLSPKYIVPNSTCTHSAKESGFSFTPGDEKCGFVLFFFF